MTISTDPIFLKKIKELREKQLRTYSVRAVDLWNNGKDSYQQEIATIGNILVVVKLPKGHEVFIQFNEIENSIIPLQEGIYLFDFYRFFLTFKHTTSSYGDTTLELLVGKDVIPVFQPTAVKQAKKIIVDSEQFIKNAPGYDQWLHVKAFSGLTQYNQLRGLIAWEQTDSLAERNFYIKQTGTGFGYQHEFVVTKYVENAEPFIVDLVGDQLVFGIYMFTGEQPVTVYLYAEVLSV